MKRIVVSVLLIIFILTATLPAFAAGMETEIAAPKNLTAKYTDFEEIELSWTAPKGANRYLVYRREENSQKWKKLDDTANTYYIDGEAVNGRTYYYKVRPYWYGYRNGEVRLGEYDKNGVKIESKIPAPKLVSVKPAGYRAVEIKWKATAGAEKYRVLRKIEGGKEWKTIAKGIEALSYTDKTAKNGVKYIYTVRGTNYERGTTHFGKYNTAGKKVTAEFIAPTEISAESTAHNRIKVSWDPVKGADGYRVYRKTSLNGKWSYIGYTKKIYYTNTVTCGKTYYYTAAGYVKRDDEIIVGKRSTQSVRKKALPAAPELEKLPAEAAVINLQWDDADGVHGYDVYRRTGGSEWEKIANVKSAEYCDEKAERDIKYSYKVKAYRTVNGKKVYSAYSNVVSGTKVRHVHFHQGDDAWGFSRRLEKTACVLSCMSMMLKNLGENATPKTVYAANGDDAGMEFDKALEYYDREYVCALSESSKYLAGYDEDWGWTYVKDPEKNAPNAIRAALDRNPEGVMCYFVRGSRRMHGILAIGYDDEYLYYSDPGRVYDKGYDVIFRSTWCKVGHRMSYKNLKFIMAID